MPALAEVGFNHAQDVLAQFRATDRAARLRRDGPILTDDHPLLEYFLALDVAQDPPDLDQFYDQPDLVALASRLPPSAHARTVV